VIGKSTGVALMEALDSLGSDGEVRTQRVELTQIHCLKSGLGRNSANNKKQEIEGILVPVKLNVRLI
jgi:hypothetical protein